MSPLFCCISLVNFTNVFSKHLSAIYVAVSPFPLLSTPIIHLFCTLFVPMKFRGKGTTVEVICCSFQWRLNGRLGHSCFTDQDTQTSSTQTHTHTKRSNIYLMGFLQLSNFQSCAVPLITHQQKQHSIPKSKPQKKTLFVEKQKLRDDERWQVVCTENHPSPSFHYQHINWDINWFKWEFEIWWLNSAI